MQSKALGVFGCLNIGVLILLNVEGSLSYFFITIIILTLFVSFLIEL